MHKIVAALCLLWLFGATAQATEWVECASADGKAKFSALAGSLGLGTATDFEVHVGEKSWSTKEGQGTHISKLQSFEDEKMIIASVATMDLSEVVAELHVFKATEGDSFVQGGVLIVRGVGAWAVICPNE